MSESTVGYVHSTESFGSVDGPGIRFVSFLQGCRMRCEFCHNPDTWNIGGGKPFTPRELLDEALKYKEFWGDKGGVTVSGGEPLLQLDFLIEYFKLAKSEGVHTALDTCGMPFTYDEPFFSKFDELMDYTDLVLYDIKHIRSDLHRKLTGWPNENILEMGRFLSKKRVPVWVRHVLVPERSDYDEYLIELDEFVKTLDNVYKVEILPYHTMGRYKWENLGIKYTLDGIEPPTEDRVINARNLLHTSEYTRYKNA
ncbi:pyruvate formate-lyase-activating protein [Atopobacter phocae]|uniref:pyruvate formate-lyase-activating protein n=1 Tax=Atopobacter phocae TaxID=136492 RepID=UPI000471B35C|nr:pyruvate formate-lyase-activating protein [Atopobacter phocae]